MNWMARRSLNRTARPLLSAIVLAAVLTLDSDLHARSFRVNMLPNGNRFGCLTCHFGFGGGPRNPFGLAVQARVSPGGAQPFWDETLAATDSDGDGWTNGEELGDPDGDGIPVPGALVTHPGDASSHPPAPEPIVIEAAGFQIEGAVGRLSWTGGKGPFLVQFLPEVGGRWLDVLSTGEHTGLVALPGGHGFFRIQDAPDREVTLLTVSLSGDHTVPPSDSRGEGLGFLAISGETLGYAIGFEGLEAPATAAHIHGPAGVGENAGVLVPLEGASGQAGMLMGQTTVDATTRDRLLAGQAYVNIHTSAEPGGEIRGQVAPVHWRATMDGTHAVPPVSTPGTGQADFTLIGNRLYWTISWMNLSSAATAAHIHGPAEVGESAGVLVPLPGVEAAAGMANGTESLAPDALEAFLRGRTYVNLHTQAHPSGEIRGQIQPVP